MSWLHLSDERFGDTGFLSISGIAVHAEHAEAVEEAILALTTRGVRHLLVDVRGLRWIGSPVLGMLARRMMSLQGSGGRSGLVGPSRHVRRTLEVTGLAPVIPAYDSLEEACADYGLPAPATATHAGTSNATVQGLTFGDAFSHA